MRIIYISGLLVICFLIIHSAYAYPQSTWAHIYHLNGAYIDDMVSIQQTIDGGYIVAGDSNSLSNTTYKDIWILKLNLSGTITWQNTYIGALYDNAKSIQQTSDGGYIVLADTNSYEGPNFHIWVIKLDTSGGVIWQYIYGGIKGDHASSIQQTSDGGYIVAGYTISCDTGNGDIWVLKLDANGGIIWQKTYGGMYHGIAYSIKQTSDGGYIVAGYTIFFDAGNIDICVLKLDANGGIIWQKTYGGLDNDVAYSIQQTSDGGYIVAGYTGSYNYSNFLVLKLDANGEIIWKRIYDSRHYSIAYSIQQTSDSGYIVAGYMSANNSADLFVLKLDENGEMGITCNLIKDSSICQNSSSIFPSDTNALITNTSIVPTHYSLPVQPTSSSPGIQCDSNNIDLQPYLGMKPEISDSGSPEPNGIIEPDEIVTLRGHLQNLGNINAFNTTGVLSTSDPINITQPNSAYGDILSHSYKYCAACYSLIAPLAHRPGTHWDFLVTDHVSADGYVPVNFYYIYHVGNSFNDVSSSYLFYSYVEKLLHSGVTSGCTTSLYCPNNDVQRQQMAKFVCTSMESANPCSCTLSSCSGIFADVASSNIFCSYIEALYNNGIVAGCQASPLKYCPNDATQRQAMAKIVCLGMESSIPGSCIATGCSGIFSDVPSSNLFCSYIEALYNTNVISGCGANLFCPDSLVNRGQMAKFLVNGFGFKL